MSTNSTLNLKEIIERIEQASTTPDFMSKLAGTIPAPAAPAAPAVAEPPAAPAEPAPAAEPTTDENLRKQAEEIDAAGRIMARSFYDELNKLAIGVVGMTPNPGAIPVNPAVQVATTEAHPSDTAQVQAIIQKLTLGERAHGTEGYVAVNGQPVAGTEPAVADQHPIAADAAKAQEAAVAAKQASAEIVDKVYAHFFGGK